MRAAALSPGLSDPVADAQGCFRALLDAMSRPGLVRRVSAELRPPAPLAPAAAAVLLTLADATTPVWTDAGSDAAAWLAFHAGCPVAGSPGDAAFVLACGVPPALDALAQGTDEEPHRGATLIAQVAALEEGRGSGGGWRLRGPGIETEHRLRVSGLPDGFAARWAANRAAFPRGVDLILCSGCHVAALPRTTAIGLG
ncbi:MAG: phosphonate C-P lyase system protein PhnH [Acetobacteraceae bacterium]|nr:phosphonate C-P lyase system protein PhnH [Acetobacteraceae bacterium]